MSDLASAPAPPAPRVAEADPAYDLVELFFFAYRDFVGGPDRILGELGFGRAHHRVLHFVTRRPGLPVADLLDVLQITKQSLNRVLKELIDQGFVASRTGTADRRQRLLAPTETGRALASQLVRLQTRRILAAVDGDADGPLADAVRGFLFGMIDPHERAKVRNLVGAAMLPP